MSMPAADDLRRVLRRAGAAEGRAAWLLGRLRAGLARRVGGGWSSGSSACRYRAWWNSPAAGSSAAQTVSGSRARYGSVDRRRASVARLRVGACFKPIRHTPDACQWPPNSSQNSALSVPHWRAAMADPMPADARSVVLIPVMGLADRPSVTIGRRGAARDVPSARRSRFIEA